jgi:hypothetical protein
MVHPTLGIIAVSFSLAIIRDRNIFFSYSAKIEALSVAFSAFRLTLVKTIDKFSAVFSASAKSLI